MTKYFEKETALKMRSSGFSVNEIAHKLGVSKSTISTWTRDVTLSSAARERFAARMNDARLSARVTLRRQYELRLAQGRKEAEKLFQSKKSHIFQLVAMIYECEGGKSINGTLEFTNSDPDLVRIFLFLLRKTFVIDESKLRVIMHLHSYHNEKTERNFWSSVTEIPPSNFYRSYDKKEAGVRKKEGYHGCVQIKYFDVSIKRILLAAKAILIKNLGL